LEATIMWTKRLFWWRSTRRQPARRRVVTVPADTAPELPADDEPRSCGWFDSSHDLCHGLQVTEHADPGAVANEVPVGWWVDWIARGDGAPQPRLMVVGVR
jgi:hypothetical protein